MDLWIRIFSSQEFLFFAYFVSVGFAISGFDDLFFDAYYFLWQIKRLEHAPAIRKFNLSSISEHKEHRIAIFVPCWHEGGVIGRMIKRAISTLKYDNYCIVVGVYKNDKATLRDVNKLAKEFPKKIKVAINPKFGPTTKAENLNSMYAHLKKVEKDGKKFEIIVLHDSEDIIHPISLRVFNYLICYLDKDMVQLPVLPWKPNLWDMVHWTYNDEFAENHLRHLVVRERIASFVPSAGVGTGYRRESLEVLKHMNGQVFNPSSLTEDYNSGLELHHRGHGTIFAVMRTESGETVATRSIFPHTVSAAIRQKTRWVIGIALQGWKQHGWRGDHKVKYTLFRDRKQLLTGPLNIFGYILLVPFFILPVFFHINPVSHVPLSLWYLFLFDTFLFVMRILLRMSAVAFFYGFTNSLMVIIRYILANYINFMASTRALYIFFFKLKNKFIPWDKTTHEFPTS